MLYRVYATIPIMIELDSSDESEIKRIVADEISSVLPSAPTDYMVDFYAEEVNNINDIYPREMDLIPLCGARPCKDIIDEIECKAKEEEDIPEDVLKMDARYLKFKEEFEDE